MGVSPLLWLFISLIGLIIVILTGRSYYKESKEIKRKKWRGLAFLFLAILSAASESTVFYFGLLLILFGLVKATGLL